MQSIGKPPDNESSFYPQDQVAFHRRYTVILFADLVGCSEISNEHDVEEYSKILHQFYAAGHLAYRSVNDLRNCFKKENSFFRCAGDEICAFLFLDPKKDFNIKECGNRISEALWYAFSLKFFWYLSQYNLLRMKNHLAPRELGIGIHFGPVAVYDDPQELMGFKKHVDVEGYTINLAKRIESSSHDALGTNIYMSRECEAVVRTDEGCRDHLNTVALETVQVMIDPKNISTYRVVFELQPEKAERALGKYTIPLFNSLAGMENLLAEDETKKLLQLCDLECEISALVKLSERIAIIREKQKLYPDNYWIKVIADTGGIARWTRVASDNEMLIKARISMSEGGYDKALISFLQLKEDWEFMSDKNLAFEVFCSLGLIYDEIRRYEDAAREYEQASALFPNHSVTLMNLGVAFDELGKQEEAIEKLRRADELMPDDPVTIRNLAIALDGIGKHEEAIEKFKRADELMPNDPVTIMNWGVSLRGIGKHEEALEKLTLADELRPYDPETLMNLGIAFDALGKQDEAIEKLARADELRPDDPDTLRNWGIALRALGKNDEAIEKYTRADRIRPNHPDTLMNWGNALGGLERQEEAIEKFKLADELRPNYGPTLMNWGIALRRSGRLEEALVIFNRVYKLDPQNRKVVRNLYQCLKAMGLAQEAEDLNKKHPTMREAYISETR